MLGCLMPHNITNKDKRRSLMDKLSTMVDGVPFMQLGPDAEYTKSLFNIIDLTSKERFENGFITLPKIEYDFYYSGKAIAHFLPYLEDFIYLWTPSEPEDNILFYKRPSCIRLRKADFNSCHDKVSRQFIQCLKIKIAVFFTLLFSGWEESKTQIKKNNLISYGDYTIVCEIINRNGLGVQLDPHWHSDIGIWIDGNANQLNQLMTLIRAESFQDNSFKLLQLAKIDATCHFNCLPIELINLIEDLYFRFVYTDEGYCRQLRANNK
jgi:hypothetical protein